MRFVAPSIFLVGAIALHGETIQERISAYVRSYADAGLFSGVVLVSKGNAVVYQQAFGLADRALKVPNTVQSKFYIASLSKPITAVGVLRLVEQGKLSLDDHLSKFVPDFPSGDKFVKLMRESARFDSIQYEPLSFGIAYLYVGVTA